MDRTMLGEDFARSMNVRLADLVYEQRRPVPLMPRRLHGRWRRMRRRSARRAGRHPHGPSVHSG